MRIRELFVPRWRHSNPDVRREAIKRQTNQAILAQVVKEDFDWKVRVAALERLTDQARIYDVAKNADHPRIRKLAVGRLSDQNTLFDFAGNEKICSDLDIQRLAISKIND